MDNIGRLSIPAAVRQVLLKWGIPTDVAYAVTDEVLDSLLGADILWVPSGNVMGTDFARSDVMPSLPRDHERVKMLEAFRRVIQEEYCLEPWAENLYGSTWREFGEDGKTFTVTNNLLAQGLNQVLQDASLAQEDQLVANCLWAFDENEAKHLTTEEISMVVQVALFKSVLYR